MILTNINGNPISQAFIDEIRSDSPNTIARLMHNSTEISCDIVSISVEKGSCGSETFTLGDVIGTKLIAIVKNLTDQLKGEEIECQIGAWTGADYEYISVCIAKVSEPKSTRYQTKLIAYSSVVSDTSMAFDTSNISSSPTISDIASIIETQTSRTITFDASIDITKVVEQPLTGLSVYQALQVIAICSGGYVVNTNDNDISVKQFGGNATLSISTGMMVKLPEFGERFEITGVYCLVQSASTDEDGAEIPAIEYSSGVVNYPFESRYITNAIFNANITDIIGYAYYPSTVNLTLGDPRLEGDDVLAVTDVDSTSYAVPCHMITHRYSGGLVSEIKSAKATEMQNDIGTVPPITSQLSAIGQSVTKAQTTASEAQSIARNNAQYFWFLESDPGATGVGTGAHITETPKEDFMQDPTNGGGNLLARSNGIAVRDGLREIATFGANGQSFNNEYSEAVFTVGTTEENIYDGKANQTEYNNESPFTFMLPWGCNSVHSASYYDIDKQLLTWSPEPSYTVDGRTVTWDATACADLISHGVKYIRVTYEAVGKFPYFTLGSDGIGDIGMYSVREGENTVASGDTAHAEGESTVASGINSHAEGFGAKATGIGSHAEGWGSLAEGRASHAENGGTAIGNYSHAGGAGTIAQGAEQTAIGSYNIAQGNPTGHSNTDYAFIIGNGTTVSRSNAFAVDWNGYIYPQNTKMVDFVTEEGAESGWYWRKWKSGKVEAWGTTSASATTGSSWGNLYYSDQSFAIPSGIFSSDPIRGYVSSRNNQWWAVGISSMSASSVSFRMAKPTSSSQAISVCIYLLYL